MLSIEQAIGLASDLYTDHANERQELDVLRRYVTGKQPVPLVIPRDAPAEVREMARLARINLIAIVVQALVESLYVDNLRGPDVEADELPEPTLTDSDGPADPLARVWRTWQANRMDKRQSGLYQAVFTYGYAYVVALPGRPLPVVNPVSPRKMIAMYDDGADFPEYALQRRRNGFRLIDAEAVYDLRRDQDGEWSMDAEGAEHGLDYCPVIRYTGREDLDEDDEPVTGETVRDILSQTTTKIVAGEVAPLMTMQDQTDVTSFALKAAEWYSAFRQRWVVGWTPESTEQKVKAGASQLWTFDEDPDAIRIGEFAETTLDGYLRSREAVLKYAATLSQTPVHELIGELVNLSAEALAAAEAGRDRKVMLARTSLGESHEQLAQVIGDLLGAAVPDDVETIWRDTSARAFGAVVDGLGKLAAQLGVPPQELWGRIPGVTRQDVKRWQQSAAAGDPLDQLETMLDRQAGGTDAPGPAGRPAPGGGTVRPSGLVLPPGARV